MQAAEHRGPAGKNRTRRNERVGGRLSRDMIAQSYYSRHVKVELAIGVRSGNVVCASSYRHLFPQWAPYLFRSGRAAVSDLTKSFVLSAHSVEEGVQNTGVDSLRISVTAGDFAQNSDLNRVFLPISHRGGPSPPESIDNPVFFHGRTHSGF